MKGEQCQSCKYHRPHYMHYPCRDCDGINQPPVTCEDCRYYPCARHSKGYGNLKPCKDFEWD